MLFAAVHRSRLALSGHKFEFRMSAFAVAIEGKADIANSDRHVCF